jgi:hypothetical protein
MKTEAHPTDWHGDSSEPQDPEVAGVVVWRERQLIAAGFGPELAAELARTCSYDLHALVGLVERGCPPRLAARILAPLEERERRPC